jgi:hypothetical protein
MAPQQAIFLDTTILIASIAHSPAMKERIRARLKQYDDRVTGLVVRQEVKRRLLKEAQYLLLQLDNYGNVPAIRRHLTEKLPPQQLRKRNICEQLITTVDETDNDEDVAERLRCFLRCLLRDGMDDLAQIARRTVEDSGCACARQPIKQRKKTADYDFGTDKCSRFKHGDCGIVRFLRERKPVAQRILKHLQTIPEKEKTPELEAASEFLLTVIDKEDSSPDKDPCLKVGDLLIALESASVPIFYTLNAAESRHLCQAVGQTLIVRRRNPDHDDEIYPPQEPPPTVDQNM